MPTDHRELDAELDQLARALPRWLLRKLIHGVGWIIIGLGYALLGLAWVGYAVFLLSREKGEAPWTWLGGLPWPIALALSICGVIVGFLLVTYVAMWPALVIASLGAYLVDPDAKRGFGVLAEKPRPSLLRGTDKGLRLVSPEGKRRLAAELQKLRSEREAERRDWDSDIKRIVAFEVRPWDVDEEYKYEKEPRHYPTLEEAQDHARPLESIVGLDSQGEVVRQFRRWERPPPLPPAP